MKNLTEILQANATESSKYHGWSFEFDFISQICKRAESIDDSEISVSAEAVNAVLSVLLELAMKTKEETQLHDKENELLEITFWELRRIYQNSVAWSDNGIPFRDVMEKFVLEWNKLHRLTLKEHSIGFANYLEGANTPSWKKMIEESYKEWIKKYYK